MPGLFKNDEVDVNLVPAKIFTPQFRAQVCLFDERNSWILFIDNCKF